MLSNLKIGTRLLLLVVVLMLAIAAAIVAGLQALKSSSMALEQQYAQKLVPIAAMGEISTAISESRSQILLALQHDPVSSFSSLHTHPLSLHTNQITSLRDLVEKEWQTIAPQLLSDDEKRVGAAFRNNLSKLYEDILTANKQLLDGAYNGANLTLLNKINPLYAETDRESDALRATLNASAESMFKSAQESYIATRTVLIGLGLGALLFGILFGTLITRSVSGGIRSAMEHIARMARGDFSAALEVKGRDEIAQVMQSMQTLQRAVTTMVGDADNLAKAAVEGKLATRADASRHEGDYRKIVEGVNATLDAVIGPLNVAADYVDRISKGAIPPRITNSYNGDFNTIKTNLNTCIDAVGALVADAVMLSQAAIGGKLATRADASKHQGDYRKIVEGVNGTLDAVINPVNEVKRVMIALSQGDLTQKIDTQYAGDFKVLQDAVNNSLDKLGEIIEQVRTAADALSNAAGQVSATAQSLSQSSSEQAASVEETSASVEQMSASINQNSENAKVTDGMATKSSTDAVEGGEAVRNTVAAMKNIAGKIGIIDD
ncbi:MAG: HAMP domain-containing protein, partial [Azoarcus sp.]|nr:HAMP domain-containing protein [Azoarcus sp.]